jgi:hypothetical protein
MHIPEARYFHGQVKFTAKSLLCQEWIFRQRNYSGMFLENMRMNAD